MSRAAAALARDPAPSYTTYATSATATTTHKPPRRGDSGPYRLLGDHQGDIFVDPFGGLVEAEIDWPIPGEEDYLEQEVEMPLAYYAAHTETRVASWRGTVLPRVLLILGIAALLALALVLVTPVLASTHPDSGKHSLVLSGYTELSVAPAPSGAMPPEIDASSAPPAAAPVETNSNASLPPAPSAQSGQYALIGPPSVSVKQIEAVLQQYGSPAAGQGQMLYDMGVKYGIDPAYALAFFVHESGCGTQGVARFTHSIGNIRWTAGYGNYQGYRKYDSWQSSMEDWYKLITDLYINTWNLRTVDAIIPVYAPTGDGNNPSVYVASVKSMVDSWRGK